MHTLLYPSKQSFGFDSLKTNILEATTFTVVNTSFLCHPGIQVDESCIQSTPLKIPTRNKELVYRGLSKSVLNRVYGCTTVALNMVYTVLTQ